MVMHDAVLSAVGASERASVTERRETARLPFPAEMTVVWHHDLDSVCRYRIIDVSDGGLRIESTLPMVTGMSGMALRLLPEGHALDRAVSVIWQRVMTCEGNEENARYEVGLQYL